MSMSVPIPPQVPIYIISYKNPPRKMRMTERFNKCGIEPIFTPEVLSNDSRLSEAPTEAKRTWAIMLQHLDAVKHFYDSKSEHCIICEDDINISKNIVKEIPEIIGVFNKLQLDQMLLGYLLPYKIEMHTCLHKQYFGIIDKTDNFTIHHYPNDIWGCQMYMISRSYAKYLLDTYTISYALKNIGNVTYNPDWIITKNGTRGLIVPMMAVEEGDNLSTDKEQNEYHHRCYTTNYNPDRYF